ncbi:hypothetical protein N7497_002180 [Penicillium chrysogenum]|nr:hypothetical protein N7497_002180 [Penicillium chrysogenum]
MPKAGHGDRSCSLAIHIRFRSMNGPGGPYIKPGTDRRLILSVGRMLSLRSLHLAAQEAGWKSTRAWWDLVTVYRAIVTAALPSSQPARHSIIISSGKLRKRGNAYDMGGSAFVVDENAEGYSSDDCALYGVKPTAFF